MINGHSMIVVGGVGFDSTPPGLKSAIRSVTRARTSFAHTGTDALSRFNRTYLSESHW
jgi:hypothetical protein